MVLLSKCLLLGGAATLYQPQKPSQDYMNSIGLVVNKIFTDKETKTYCYLQPSKDVKALFGGFELNLLGGESNVFFYCEGGFNVCGKHPFAHDILGRLCCQHIIFADTKEHPYHQALTNCNEILDLRLILYDLDPISFTFELVHFNINYDRRKIVVNLGCYFLCSFIQ